MLKIEYEVDLNESGRPCIELSDDYEHRSEDKFFAIEMTRYFLQSAFARRSAEFDKDTSISLDIAIRLLGQIGDEMANLVHTDMVTMGEVDFMLNKQYHSVVKTIEERNAIGKFVVANSKLYKRQEGLKVLVQEDSTIYTLIGGDTNENWSK